MERLSVGLTVGVSVLVVGLAALAVGTYAPDVAPGAAFVVIVASFLMGGAVGMNSPDLEVLWESQCKRHFRGTGTSYRRRGSFERRTAPRKTAEIKPTA